VDSRPLASFYIETVALDGLLSAVFTRWKS